jgi:predicted aldo/keto reductase-like oxidoreductase
VLRVALSVPFLSQEVGVMSDREPASSSMDRRLFLQTGAAASAAVTLASGASAHAAQEADAQESVLPTRGLGRTGVKVTLLNQGTVQAPSALDRLLRFSYERGVRYFDTAAAYGTEAGFKKWFSAMPEVRKNIFLATKDGVGSPADMLKRIDVRLEALGTDYIDLLFFHGLGSNQVDWPKSKEMKQAAEAIKKTGKVRFVGFTTHDAKRPEQLQAAAEGNFVDVIMLQFSPWLAKDSALNKAIDACHAKKIGLVSMKQLQGLKPADVFRKVPVLKERGLNAHQGLLTAIWSDERMAATCVTMMNTDQVKENVEAARKFEPLKTADLLDVRDATLASGPMMCTDCDGRCGHAAGTKARLGDLTRFLSYHEHMGARRMAREEYAKLSDEERAWHDADLDAARSACPSQLDFAQLLPKVDRLLG